MARDHTDMIKQSMSIHELVSKHPETIPVFARFGISCIGCEAALFESVEDGASVHGIDVEILMANLRKAIERS